MGHAFPGLDQSPPTHVGLQGLFPHSPGSLETYLQVAFSLISVYRLSIQLAAGIQNSLDDNVTHLLCWKS